MAHTILLVDDVVSNLMLLEKMLAGKGFRCVRATSGSRALALLESEPVSVVLLDVQMPDMDGCEVARRIRARETWSGIPIIFITASATAEDASHARKDAPTASVPARTSSMPVRKWLPLTIRVSSSRSRAAVGYQLLAFSFRLSAFGYRLFGSRSAPEAGS